MTQKVAVITGGATGIGKSTPMLLAGKGIKVVFSGRREAEGQKAIEEIRAEGRDAFFIAVDVDNETQVSQMIGFAIKSMAVWTWRLTTQEFPMRQRPLEIQLPRNFRRCYRPM
jgi:NAD(P)-dependent dehydrogenase (short-subunit alcohol dehydrogenase family)